MRRLLALAAVLPLVLSCKPDGTKQYQAALERYQALVAQGTAPADPAFDEVLKDLRKVPDGSKQHGPALALAETISRARAPKVERPLVTPFAAADDEPEVAAKKTECEALAKALGSASPEARPALQSKLDLCRAQQHEIEGLRHSKDHGH